MGFIFFCSVHTLASHPIGIHLVLNSFAEFSTLTNRKQNKERKRKRKRKAPIIHLCSFIVLRPLCYSYNCVSRDENDRMIEWHTFVVLIMLKMAWKLRGREKQWSNEWNWGRQKSEKVREQLGSQQTKVGMATKGKKRDEAQLTTSVRSLNLWHFLLLHKIHW